MRLPTSSVESITRPRLAVAIVSAVTALSIGYYAYQSRYALDELPPGPGLHRSNAVRRARRNGRNRSDSASSSEAAGDENADASGARPFGEGETLVEDDVDEWWNDTNGYQAAQRAGQNLVTLLFRVCEDNIHRNSNIHRGCQCNSCGMVPIRGVRFRCANCPDYDLCETCESKHVHIKTHVFYKIRFPTPPFGPRQMQPVWYTGDPDNCRATLPKSLVPRLSRETGFERPELESCWEQWTYMAGTEWRDDPDGLGIAMDRKTFERWLVPTGGSLYATPNLIHDRMFAFYDTNKDGLVGFTEYLHGLSYRKRKDKLKKIFEGYDMDADGYVDRRDFLRMFRAYYVLYKQMHKDILAGLDDEALSSIDSQLLVASRQPLSGRFGRDTRIPRGETQLRAEGKTFHRDGRVEVEEGYENVVADDRPDTASRQDILTNLMAFDTETRSLQRFITGNDTDADWRTVRRLSGTDADRAYWVTLLEPPTNLDELPGILMGTHSFGYEASYDDDDDVEENPYDGDNDRINGVDEGDLDPFASAPMTESQGRERHIARIRARAPRLEKHKRDMARKQLHERWKRRQFYLDEEEGGSAPLDWEDDEDILNNVRARGESSKSAERDIPSPHSGSSSLEDLADTEDHDAASLSSVSMASTSDSDEPPNWELPSPERDAGKEILYQVTQQAFNEMLDIIFKPAEDVAVKAAESKKEREKYKHLLDDVELEDDKVHSEKNSTNGDADAQAKAIKDKSLDELLVETGFTVEGRNAVEIDTTVEILENGDAEDPNAAWEPATEPRLSEDGDPTLPQFRPNSSTDVTYDDSYVFYPRTTAEPIKETEEAEEEEPSMETLQAWKRLNIAEEQAAMRGGWGKLSLEEFEAIYNQQQDKGNRLDYLGTWIDFCIP